RPAGVRAGLARGVSFCLLLGALAVALADGPPVLLAVLVALFVVDHVAGLVRSDRRTLHDFAGASRVVDAPEPPQEVRPHRHSGNGHTKVRVSAE
ncbi:MAG: hypothetical protein ACR2NA_13090, partial [Solirubrobacterales bacterium]